MPSVHALVLRQAGEDWDGTHDQDQDQDQEQEQD